MDASAWSTPLRLAYQTFLHSHPWCTFGLLRVYQNSIVNKQKLRQAQVSFTFNMCSLQQQQKGTSILPLWQEHGHQRAHSNLHSS
jgi:hypothetical protein